MNAKETLATLKKLGKPQTAAIYKHYGTGSNVYGVLTSEIAKLKKKIKIDHALSLELWKTGNAEARVLALQVADPAKVTQAHAKAFVADGQFPFVGWYLSDLVARTPVADKTMRDWMEKTDEHSREMGYSVLASRLKNDADAITDADAAEMLATIEKEIHQSANWARYAMNSALIAIGVFKPALRKKAVAAAKRIGKVVVDHGETHCKTPDAAPYIVKASQRKARR